MTQDSSDLTQEVLRISGQFTQLGERLLGAARHLHSPGTPPPEELIAELEQARTDFVELRQRAVERASELSLGLPPAETLETVQGLTALVDLVAESEVLQGQAEESRRRALSGLDRILTLRYTGGEFQPLTDCQRQAQLLRDSIAQSSWNALPEEADALSEGGHPFSNLLALVNDREVLNDDLWASYHDTIGATFGKALAAAAARSKLVLPDPSHTETLNADSESVSATAS